MPATSWCSPSGLPSTTRSFANAVTSSSRRCAAPTQRAATISRSNRNQSWREGHALALGPDQVRHRHPHPIERHDRMLVGDVMRIVRRANDFHPRPRQVDDQQHVLAVVFAAHQTGLDEQVLGQVVGRDVPLDPVDDVLVALPTCGRLQRGDVRPGELLGDGVGLVLLAPHRGQQPALASDSRWPRRPTTAAACASPRPARWSPGRICSCTSTCCSAVHPWPPTDVGMLVAYSPNSIALA